MNCEQNIIHINCRSILPKFDSLRNYILVKKIYIATVSESLLNKNVLDEIVIIEGYNSIRLDRSQRRGGGVLMYIRDGIEFTKISDLDVRRAD